MAAGLTANITLAQFNQQAGTTLLNLVTALDQVNQMNAFLTAQGAAGLTALFGMVTADGNNVISAFSDAQQLYNVFHGTATQASQKDFTAFIKLVIGTGVH